MNRRPVRRTPMERAAVLLLVLALTLPSLPACAPSGGGGGAPPRPTPAPPWAGKKQIEDVTPEEIRAYLAGTATGAPLVFDETHGIGDEQRLMVIDPATHAKSFGPQARIEPEVGNATLGGADVRAGRIVARITITKPDFQGNTAYRELGIVDRVSYLWVEELPGPDGRPRPRAFLLSADSSARAALRLELGAHGRRYPNVALARWLPDDADDGIWTSCAAECCTVTGFK